MTRPKLAFVHLMRTGGTYVNARFAQCYSPADYHNSWYKALDRDWTPEELTAFLITDRPSYVHNHVFNWNASLIRAYQQQGFYVFSFIRDPGDQLCSLYFWLRTIVPVDLTLDEFLQCQLGGEEYCEIDFRHWAIPDYWSTLDSIEPFSEFAVDRLLHRSGVPEPPLPPPERQNASTSPGYAECCRRAWISIGTQRRLQTSEYQRRYEEVLRTVTSELSPGG